MMSREKWIEIDGGIATAVTILMLFGYGALGVLMILGVMKAIIKTDEARDVVRIERAVNIESISQDWLCDADQCCYPGLEYCSPTDKRFEK